MNFHPMKIFSHFVFSFFHKMPEPACRKCKKRTNVLFIRAKYCRICYELLTDPPLNAVFIEPHPSGADFYDHNSSLFTRYENGTLYRLYV